MKQNVQHTVLRNTKMGQKWIQILDREGQKRRQEKRQEDGTASQSGCCLGERKIMTAARPQAQG